MVRITMLRALLVTSLLLIGCSSDGEEQSADVGPDDGDTQVSDNNDQPDAEPGDTDTSPSTDVSSPEDVSSPNDVEPDEDGGSTDAADPSQDAGEPDPLDGPGVDFIDTFEDGEVDTEKWLIGTWTEHGGQLSTDRVNVEDDKLVMSFEYDQAFYDDTGLFKGSAIQTRREDFSFGRWESRLKIPDEDGVLPTMYTIDWRDNGGQTRQEIDIEFVTINIDDDHSEVHFAVHGADFDSWETQVELPFNPADDFHVWGFDISEERIKWFVDDIDLYEYWYDDEDGVIDAPYMLKYNFWSARLEDGGAGNWIQGPPVADTEIRYTIDWVRFLPHD